MKVDRLPELLVDAYQENFASQREVAGDILQNASSATKEGDVDTAIKLSHEAGDLLRNLPRREQEEDVLKEVMKLANTFAGGLQQLGIDEIPDDFLAKLGMEAAERQGIVFQAQEDDFKEVAKSEEVPENSKRQKYLDIESQKSRLPTEQHINELAARDALSSITDNRQLNLSEKQLAYAAVTYRINIPEDIESVDMRTAAKHNEELLMEAGIHDTERAVLKRHSSVESANTKLERVIEAVSSGQQESLVFPLPEDVVKLLKEFNFNRTASLIAGMNKVEVYEGMNVEEAYAYASSNQTGAVSLKKDTDNQDESKDNEVIDTPDTIDFAHEDDSSHDAVSH